MAAKRREYRSLAAIERRNAKNLAKYYERMKDPEKRRALRARQRELYAAKDEVTRKADGRARQLRRYNANREDVLAYRRKWAEEHPEQYRQHKQNAYAGRAKGKFVRRDIHWLNSELRRGNIALDEYARQVRRAYLRTYGPYHRRSGSFRHLATDCGASQCECKLCKGNNANYATEIGCVKGEE